MPSAGKEVLSGVYQKTGGNAVRKFQQFYLSYLKRMQFAVRSRKDLKRMFACGKISVCLKI